MGSNLSGETNLIRSTESNPNPKNKPDLITLEHIFPQHQTTILD